MASREKTDAPSAIALVPVYSLATPKIDYNEVNDGMRHYFSNYILKILELEHKLRCGRRE